MNIFQQLFRIAESCAVVRFTQLWVIAFLVQSLHKVV